MVFYHKLPRLEQAGSQTARTGSGSSHSSQLLCATSSASGSMSRPRTCGLPRIAAPMLSMPCVKTWTIRSHTHLCNRIRTCCASIHQSTPNLRQLMPHRPTSQVNDRLAFKLIVAVFNLRKCHRQEGQHSSTGCMQLPVSNTVPRCVPAGRLHSAPSTACVMPSAVLWGTVPAPALGWGTA